jgi:hypothetical protein
MFIYLSSFTSRLTILLPAEIKQCIFDIYMCFNVLRKIKSLLLLCFAQIKYQFHWNEYSLRCVVILLCEYVYIFGMLSIKRLRIHMCQIIIIDCLFNGIVSTGEIKLHVIDSRGSRSKFKVKTIKTIVIENDILLMTMSTMKLTINLSKCSFVI